MSVAISHFSSCFIAFFILLGMYVVVSVRGHIWSTSSCLRAFFSIFDMFVRSFVLISSCFIALFCFSGMWLGSGTNIRSAVFYKVFKPPPRQNMERLNQEGPKSRWKGNSGGILGLLARRLKIATRAKYAASEPNWAEIPSERPLWTVCWGTWPSG